MVTANRAIKSNDFGPQDGFGAACYRVWEKCDKPRKYATAMVLLPFAFQVGTGGVFDQNYLQERGQRGYSLPVFEIRDDLKLKDKINGHSTAIQNIKNHSDLSVTDIATIMNVSRTAIYDWQSGKRITIGNDERLAELSAAVTMISQHRVGSEQLIYRRKLKEGKSFIQLTKDGSSIQETAELLVKVLSVEHDERQKMEKLFGSRKKKPISFDDVDTAVVHES